MSREDWQKHTDWMRVVGAQAATWDEEGRLRSVALGPVPVREDQSKRETSHSPQTERQREDMRRRVILQAGPRLREVPGGRSDKP